MAKFVITGEMLTERIRDFWASKQYSKAIEYGLESIDGMTIDYLREIIDGRKQLVGSDLDFIDDNFDQEFKYTDIFKFADMNSDLFQRIYNEDIDEGLDIIRWFWHFGESGNLWRYEDHWQSKVSRWKKLLPDVRNELSVEIPYWMSLYLRKADVIEENKKFGFSIDNIVSIKCAAVTNKTLLYQYFDEISDDRKIFDKKCKELYLFDESELDEIWNSMQNLKKLYPNYKPRKQFSLEDQNLDVIEPDPIETTKKILEEELVKDIEMKCDNGWLSPDGTYYICGHGGHQVVAKYICEKYNYDVDENIKLQFSYADILLKKNWIQIHQPERWEKFQMTHCRKLTYEQERKIERYESIHKKLKENDVSFMIK